MLPARPVLCMLCRWAASFAPAIMLHICCSYKTVSLCQLSLFHSVTPCLCLQDEYKQLGWHLVEP